jgi:hypothetical protein
LLAGATAMTLALVLSSSPSLADPGRGRGHKHGHGNGHGHKHEYYRVEHRPIYHSVARAHFAVPHHIVHAETYAPYYSGRVWYAPHRHAHLVYAFPAYSPYGVAYEPHYYCGHELYVAAPGYAYDSYYRSRAPRVSVGIHLGF